MLEYIFCSYCIILLFFSWIFNPKKYSLDPDTYKDLVKGKSSEIHLTSSEVRAGSKIESSLLYEQPMLSLEEKCASKVNMINTIVYINHYP